MIIDIEDAREKCAKNLREIRRRDDLTQREMLKRLNECGANVSSQSVISAYESGERLPDFDMLNAYVNYANVSCDAIMGRADLGDVPIEDLITDAELLGMVERASEDTIRRVKGIFRYLLFLDDNEVIDPDLYREYKNLDNDDAMDRLERLIDRMEKMFR